MSSILMAKKNSKNLFYFIYLFFCNFWLSAEFSHTRWHPVCFPRCMIQKVWYDLRQLRNGSDSLLRVTECDHGTECDTWILFSLHFTVCFSSAVHLLLIWPFPVGLFFLFLPSFLVNSSQILSAYRYTFTDTLLGTSAYISHHIDTNSSFRWCSPQWFSLWHDCWCQTNPLLDIYLILYFLISLDESVY